MNAQEYFDLVTLRNIDDLEHAPDDFRAAINAIKSLDDLFGILAIEKEHPDDKPYKDALALNNAAWRLVRDTSYSFKHGLLKGTNTRLIFSPAGVVVDGERWNDAGVWDDSATWPSGASVFIEYVNSGSGRVRAIEAVKKVKELAVAELSGVAAPICTIAELSTNNRMFRYVHWPSRLVRSAAGPSRAHRLRRCSTDKRTVLRDRQAHPREQTARSILIRVIRSQALQLT